MSTSERDILIQAGRRAGRGEPFVLVTVVRRAAPSSARPAQKALVLPDGTLRGFVGGSCIEPIARREALAALADGRPRRVLLSPDAGGQDGSGPDDRSGPPVPGGAAFEPGVRSYPMTCHSGGTVELFLEPYLPAPILRLYGESPVIHALEEMVGPLGWVVRRSVEPGAGEAEGGQAIVGEGGEEGAAPGAALLAVVATMGVWDETAAEEALEAGASYVGLIASPRRTGEVRRRLADRGVPEERLERLVGPAGLDLGAETPAEIAVSILAEIVERRLASAVVSGDVAVGGAHRTAAGQAAATGGSMAVDPVCGMEVDPATARVTFRLEDTVYYFCCEGCRERFQEDPAAFGAA